MESESDFADNKRYLQKYDERTYGSNDQMQPTAAGLSVLGDDLARLADEGDDSDSDDGEAAEARQRLEHENFGKRQAARPS